VVDTIPTMAWIFLPDGTMEFINKRWLDYSGLSLDQALENPTRTVHPDDLAKGSGKMGGEQGFRGTVRG